MTDYIERTHKMTGSRLTFLVVTMLCGAMLWSIVMSERTGSVGAAPSSSRKGDSPRRPLRVGHPTFASPHASPIAVHGGDIFVANTPADTVDVIDSETRKVRDRINVGIDPVSVVIRPDGKEVWVSNHVSDSVSVIDNVSNSPTYLQVVATIQHFDPKSKATTFDEPIGIAFAGNDKAYVALSSENQIAVINVAARQVTKRLRIPAQDPRAIAVHGDRLYVIPFESNNKTQLSGGSKDDIDDNLVTFDAWEHSIRVNNVLSLGHVTDIVKHPEVPDRDLFVFDTKTDELVETVDTLGTLLYGLTVDSKGRVFIAQTDARNDANGRAGTKKHGMKEMENRAFLNQITKLGFGEPNALASGATGEGDVEADPLQRKNLADDARLSGTKADLRKWLPKSNAPHFRGNESASGESRTGSYRPSTATRPVGTGPKRGALTKRPNVVVLLADDLGSKDLGCYGGPVKTPVLDNLAARGVKFTDFHAGGAVCSPSRATLLTGRQNLRTGIYGVLQDKWHDMHLLEREVTIAEVLGQAGYGTAHFGKWHIGMTSGKRKKPSPTQHGFDYWFGLSNGASPSHKNPVNFRRNGRPVGPLNEYSCQLVVDDAIDWLETKANPDQPFFMNIWFNEPHATLAAPDEIVSIYGDLKDEEAIYSATIDNTDRAIGRLVTRLKKMGKLDNTLIIYSSDHGSYRTDRNGGLKGNKGSNFQGGLRSPGIFFWPDGFKGGRVENAPSGSVDLLPTICGLIGIDKPKDVHLDGADLSPLLTERGKFQRTQPLFWLSPSSGHLATLREGDYTLMGYRGYQLPSDQARKNELLREMAKLAGIDPRAPNLGSRVTNTTFTSPEYNRLKAEFVRLRTFQEAWIPTIKAGGFSRFALYDLNDDPLQKKDVSKQRPEVTERLKKKLLAFYKDVMADAPDWNSK